MTPLGYMALELEKNIYTYNGRQLIQFITLSPPPTFEPGHLLTQFIPTGNARRRWLITPFDRKVFRVVDSVFVFIFFAELLLRIFVERTKFLKDVPCSVIY